MSFNPNIPIGTDNLSTSRGQIQTNFSTSNTIFAIDHFAFDDATSANRGKHRKLQFPVVLGSDPVITGTASEIYTKSISAHAEAFFANDAAANVLWRGGSGSGLVSQTTGGALSNGSLTLPNGIIFQWGYTGTVSDGATITFPSAFPTACFQVQLTVVRNNNNVRSLNLNAAPTTTNFVIRTSAGSIAATWLAIGN